MTVRYVGVAYAVPVEFIFAQLNIPYNRRNVNETLKRLNDEYTMGISPTGNYPLLLIGWNRLYTTTAPTLYPRGWMKSGRG